MELTINTPDLWKKHFPWKKAHQHKYDHGLALIYGANGLLGATRLASEACARIGCGLVTVLCTKESAPIYKSTLPAHILVREDLSFAHPKTTARLCGPGDLACTIDTFANPSQEIATVLDAEAIGFIRDLKTRQGDEITPPPKTTSETNERAPFVLTPHTGEFERHFDQLPQDPQARNKMLLSTAKKYQAYIVLKGPTTFIASPQGKLAFSNHASPYLATAGTGDVLAGLITGLLAQKMPPFQACLAAVWIHGAASLQIGPGLVANDLLLELPKILKALHPWLY